MRFCGGISKLEADEKSVVQAMPIGFDLNWE